MGDLAVPKVATMEAPLRAGLIGSGIGASRTPSMHRVEGAALGLSYEYELIDLKALDLDADALPALLDSAERRGLVGLNVTYPCKQRIIPLLDSLSVDAAALQAVNTVVFRGGRREGHNTDWSGFTMGLQSALPDAELDTVVLLGAGGAGAAVGYALLRMGAARLVVVDIDHERAHQLADQLRLSFPDRIIDAEADVARAMASATGLVHATPTGMASHPGLPLPESLLDPGLWVADIVYFPLETELLRVAAAKGCRVVNGGGMAIFQAVGAFRLFTGMEPDPARMRRHFVSMGS